MKNSIDVIKDYYKMDSGKFELKLKKFNLKDLIIQTMLIFRLQSKMRNLNFELDYEDNLTHIINNDPYRIR